MKKWIITTILFSLALLMLAGCGETKVEEIAVPETTPLETTTQPQPVQPQPAPTPPSQSSFETVGMFDNGRLMVAISYYVANPTKADITRQCDVMKARFIDSDITTNLRISFFDDRAMTPDYAAGYDIPEANQPFEVANYYYNASNSETRLLFLKTIP
jgi:hypothetical protein